MARSCRIYCLGCDSGQRCRDGSKFEFKLRKPGIVGLVKSGKRIFQARWRRWRAEEALVEERNFWGDRKTGRRPASHIIAVNMHDVEVTLDLLDKGIESLRKNIDVVEFDGD